MLIEDTDKICPFYAKDENLCDVGCGYISPRHVNQIIKFCSARYDLCPKYIELIEVANTEPPKSTD